MPGEQLYLAYFAIMRYLVRYRDILNSSIQLIVNLQKKLSESRGCIMTLMSELNDCR